MNGNDYLNAIEDQLNQRKGMRAAIESFNNCKNKDGEVDITSFNAITFAGDGFGDGVCTFFDGIGNVFREDGMISETQYKQMYLLQALNEAEADVLSFAYQNGSSIGNMAIPMVVSAITGCAAIGSVLIGASGLGNTKNQVLIDGYSSKSAWIYGICSGLSESVLSYFLGKIPGISKTSGFTIGNLLQEGFEEFLQEYVDAGLRAVCLGEEIDLNTLNADALKSFAMGVIIAGELNAGTALAVKIKGLHVEIPLSEIEEYCKSHPEEDVVDVLLEMIGDQASIEEYRKMKDGNYDVFGIDQGFFAKLLGGRFSITQDAKNIARDVINANEAALRDFIMSELHWSSDAADNGVLELKDIVTKPDTTSVTGFTRNFLCDFLTYMHDSGEIDSDTENGFKNGVHEPIKLGDDMFKIRQNLLDYMAKQGMSPEETVKTLSVYDNDTGGICSYAAFANAICQQLSEETFLQHFGFEKYVTVDGKKVYNPLLLADIVFNLNKEGSTSEPNIIQGNDGYHLKDGRLDPNPLARPILAFDTELANEYLGSKGLEAEQQTKQARWRALPRDISGIPKEGPIISADYLSFIIDTAIEEGATVILSVGGKESVTLIDMDTNEVRDFKDTGHSVTVFGRNEEGILVSSYGREMLLPYGDIRNYSYQNSFGTEKLESTVGYSVIKVSEKGE